MSEAGILTIGSTSRDLGIISSASAAVCRSFGFSRNQLERRSLSVLMPAPIGDILMSRLTAFMNGDSTVRLSDTVRCIFGKHKAGTIFPAYLLIRESLDHGTNSDSEERHAGPSLLAMVRPIQTTESFLIVDSRFNITGADSRTLTLL